MATTVSHNRRTLFQLPGLGTVARASDSMVGVTNGDFKTPYPYTRFLGKSKPARNVNGHWTAMDAGAWNRQVKPDSAKWQPTKNKAYSRLVNDVNGTQSQLGTFFAEWRESQGMITKRALGLRNAYSALRRGDFRRFLRELSVSPKRKHRGRVRNAANEASGLWLEYWFGWAPTIGDIYTACEQLSEPLPSGIRKQGSAKDFLFSGFNTAPNGRTDFCQNTGTFRTGARFSLVNPNLYLASQMGLINPASVAWEIVPFSFMVDWVADVGSFLDSFSDFAGLSVEDAYWNSKIIYHSERSGRPDLDREILDQVHFRRHLGLLRPLPNLGILQNLGQSHTRAATAVSLLVQVLKT